MSQKKHIEALRQTAFAAVSYVAHANYPERERAANRAINAAAETGKYCNPEDFDK